jgi:DNA-binding MarR family transcriptional regulator
MQYKGMKFLSLEQQNLIGISRKESVLLDTLYTKGSQNTSELAYNTSLPRVTVMRLLKNLRNRNLVKRKEKSREVVWKIENAHDLSERFNKLFGGSINAREHNIALSEVGRLTIYRGMEEMLESNRILLAAHPGERILAIEPNGIWKHFSLGSAGEWSEINKLFKQKQILIEMVVEDGFDSVLSKSIPLDLQNTYLSLAVEIRVVPSGVLDSATEILIFRDQVLFTDWAHNVAVEIKNPSTVRVIKAMYRMLQKNGRPYEKMPILSS